MARSLKNIYVTKLITFSFRLRYINLFILKTNECMTYQLLLLQSKGTFVMTISKLNLITATNNRYSLNSSRTRSMRTKIADGRHIPAGAIITSQITANSLPSVNSVTLRRQAKVLRKKLFNGNQLHIVSNEPKSINNIVAKNRMVA